MGDDNTSCSASPSVESVNVPQDKETIIYDEVENQADNEETLYNIIDEVPHKVYIKNSSIRSSINDDNKVEFRRTVSIQEPTQIYSRNSFNNTQDVIYDEVHEDVGNTIYIIRRENSIPDNKEKRPKLLRPNSLPVNNNTSGTRRKICVFSPDNIPIINHETDTVYETRPPSVKRRAVSTNVTPTREIRTQRRIVSTNDIPNLRNSPSTENMVLQLVFPGDSGNSSNIDNNNYLTTRSLDEILGNNSQLTNKSNTPQQQQDVYADFSNGPNGAYINHGFIRGSFSMDSMPQTPAPSTDSHSLKPTPEDEKTRFFWETITTILSGMYGLFIITVGLAVYVTDLIDGSGPIAEIYSLYLVTISLIFLLYLNMDVSFHMKKVREYHKSIDRNLQSDLDTYVGQFQMSLTAGLPEPEHYYCLSKDQHAANFYLKMGAAIFCFGHLIHSLLLLSYQIMFLRSDSDLFNECVTLPTLILDIVYPIYSFLLLYFLFKYSNIIIKKHAALAKFGIMHCMCSSICFWLWTIFRETVEALANKSKDYDDEDDYPISEEISETDFDTETSTNPIALALTSYNRKGAKVLTSYLNNTVRRFTQVCDQDTGMQKIYQEYSPYLYPFSVEYSILVVGVLFIIWQNIGICSGPGGELKCKEPVLNTEHQSNLVIHADFHASNRGLFGGIVVLLISVVGIILFFITMSSEEKSRYAINIYLWVSILVICLMLVTSILAYRQIKKLDLNTHYHNLLDDLLLIICIPAFFLNGIFSLIPAISNQNAISSINIILEVLQVLIQTLFIMDGLRRTSNTKKLRVKSPGRELVTFLIVCNVSIWISQTFEVKSHGLLDDRYEFYGKELWTILGHMCLPLMMFYRFHSSVCIVDIWKYAYEAPHQD